MWGSFSYPNSPVLRPLPLLCLYRCVSVVCCNMPTSFLFFGGDTSLPPRPTTPNPPPRSHFVMPSTLHIIAKHTYTRNSTFFYHNFIADGCVFVSEGVSVCWCMYFREWVGELSHIYKPIIISLLISLCSEEINFLHCVCLYVCVCVHMYSCCWVSS